MKSFSKILGFTAIAAVIVFGFNACGGDTIKPYTNGGDSITPHTHTWSANWQVDIPATCMEPGREIKTCSGCNEIQKQEIAIDPDAHDYQPAPGALAPTCTEDGYGGQICAHNDEHTVAVGVISKLNHDYQNYKQTTAPTCTTAGIETGTCTHDSLHKDTRTGAAALGHDHEESLVCKRTACNHQYELGDNGPGGGKIFYVADGQSGRDLGFTVQGYGNTGDTGYFAQYTAHYLEAAPEDFGTFKWGLLWVNISTGTAIGDGRKNTQIIVAALAESNETNCAAQVCDTYNNGYDDWFLPSKDELNQLRVNRNIVGNLGASVVYFSSSHGFSNTYVYVQDFNNGYQNSGFNRGDTSTVRAVRAF